MPMSGRGFFAARRGCDLHCVHRIERAAFQYHEVTLGDIREIDQQIHALGGREQYLLATNASFEQSAIGADQDERKRSGIDAAEREPIRSRVRCVEQSQPVTACRDIVIRTQAAVDVGQAPVPAQQFVFRGGRVAIAVASAAILQHQRELGVSGREIERLPHDALVVVGDLDEPEEAAIDLARRRAMRVRVVPIQAGAVAHRERVVVAFAGRDQRFPIAIVARVHREPVPVHDRRLR